MNIIKDILEMHKDILPREDELWNIMSTDVVTDVPNLERAVPVDIAEGMSGREIVEWLSTSKAPEGSIVYELCRKILAEQMKVKRGIRSFFDYKCDDGSVSTSEFLCVEKFLIVKYKRLEDVYNAVPSLVTVSKEKTDSKGITKTFSHLVTRAYTHSNEGKSARSFAKSFAKSEEALTERMIEIYEELGFIVSRLGNRGRSKGAAKYFDFKVSKGEQNFYVEFKLNEGARLFTMLELWRQYIKMYYNKNVEW